MKTYRYWFALHPDINRAIGGVKQAHRLVEQINSLGHRATVIQDKPEFHPGWFQSNVPTIGYKELKERRDLNPEQDVVILPETFIHILDKYIPHLPKILFNQNGSYTFGLNQDMNPNAVLQAYQHPSLAHILCVSQADFLFLTDALGLDSKRVNRVVNSIESDLFLPGPIKRKQIAYMPRKNKADAKIVHALLARKAWFQGWELKPLQGLSLQEVSIALQESLGFLSFGHPEGFGLPLAEAAACGCYLIGYSGIGGREVFEIALKNSTGYEVSFGDWKGFIQGAKEFVSLCDKNVKSLMKDLACTSKLIRKQYSTVEMRTSVANAIADWEPNLQKVLTH